MGHRLASALDERSGVSRRRDGGGWRRGTMGKDHTMCAGQPVRRSRECADTSLLDTFHRRRDSSVMRPNSLLRNSAEERQVWEHAPMPPSLRDHRSRHTRPRQQPAAL